MVDQNPDQNQSDIQNEYKIYSCSTCKKEITSEQEAAMAICCHNKSSFHYPYCVKCSVCQRKFLDAELQEHDRDQMSI